MKDVMIDLETLGLRPNSVILAIGAVRFSIEAGIDTENSFFMTIDASSCVAVGMEMEADTIKWWINQSDEAKRVTFNDSQAQIQWALEKFADWLEPGDRVWGNGAAFDNVILANAYYRCGMRQPWGFRNDRCYRSLKSLKPEIQLARVGIHHHALDDAISQARHAVDILRAISGLVTV